MMTEKKFMLRALQLAEKGRGYTAPNPLVGAVIVCNNRIIGEGYHKKYGEPHAEVNAIASVNDKSLLSSSIMYVTLEPCSHYGKTPPCAELIVRSKLKKVIVATRDPNPKVSGRGIGLLQEAGVEVEVGLCEKEAKEINRAFFTNQLFQRPYIVLKWAQSADGYMDRLRSVGDPMPPVVFSNTITQTLVHKMRTHFQGIMVGTNTVLLDNPALSARKWYGKNPTRIIIDKEGIIPATANVFKTGGDVFVFTKKKTYPHQMHNVKAFVIDFEDKPLRTMLQIVMQASVFSILVEGGSALLNSFLEEDLWDEAFIETSPKKLGAGVVAPLIDKEKALVEEFVDTKRYHLKNEITRNFI